MHHDRDLISVRPTPVASPQPQRIPPIVAKTVNLCVNCVQAPGRIAKRVAQHRYHRHYHPRHRFGRYHLAADVAFVAVIVALLGVNAWLLLGKPQILPSKVRLAWDAPAPARVGDAVTLALVVAYEGDVPLDRATVAFITPSGFTVTSAAPGTYDATTHTLTLPAPIAPGASIGVTVDGVIESPSDRDLTLTATFHGIGAAGAERQSANAAIAVRGIAFAFVLEAPSRVPENGIAGLALRYRSDAAIPLPNIVIRPTPSYPLALVHEDPWGTPRTIASGENGRLTFAVRTKGAGSFPLDVAVFQTRPDGSSVALGGFSPPLEVAPVPVQFGIASQGDGSPVASLGATVEIGASYQGLNGVALPAGFARAFEVRVAGPLVHASRLQAVGASDVQRTRVRFPFTPLPAGEIGGAGFTITLPSAVDSSQYADGTDFAYTFTPVLWLSGGDGIGVAPSARVEGDPFTLAIIGELHISSSARYFTPEGDQIGRGPLPPRVGETTRYWVTWDLRATIQDADHVEARATLPQGIEWTNRVATTAGDGVAYDTATRTVTWTVDSVPRTIGSTYPTVSASFELALTSDATMVGRPAALLGETVVEGVDAFGIPLRVTAPPLTTELPHDARARGKGIVR